jgi:hypothetical protein
MNRKKVGQLRIEASNVQGGDPIIDENDDENDDVVEQCG